MKKFKKLLAMGLAVMAAVSAMSMSAFASTTTLAEQNSASIDYSVYDSDMVYVPEHAELIEEYNNSSAITRATTMVQWPWSFGIYSYATGSNSGYVVPYYFTPVSNNLYFYVDVAGAQSAPFMTVNKYNSDGSLLYVGSYYITSVGNGTYQWNNYRRSLNAGENYAFAVFAYDGWDSMSIDIYKQSF